jgi:adenine-specific DNA-methyltransferase
MSRLTELLRRVEQQNPALGKELASEIKALTARRAFGLNFERHVPETFDLPGRKIRRGDKVRFRAPRGAAASDADDRIWLVAEIAGSGAERTAYLVEHQVSENPRVAERLVDDLVAVAEFRDPIHPGLKSTGKMERGGDKPFHTVINGENYHALEALLFAYEGKIDCIYIDPPYNTRDKDWKYNNDYVDSDDAYKHSKWLAMMERRLTLAKRLLNPASAVLILTIDEKEVHRLGLLLEQEFPSYRAQMVSIVINPLGQERSQELSRVEEYAFFIFIGSAAPCALGVDFLADRRDTKESNRSNKVRWERLIRGGADAARHKRPDLYYPIFIDPLTRSVASVGEPLLLDQDRRTTTEPEGTVAVWPLRTSGQEGRWRCSPAYFRKLLKMGYAKVGDYDRARGQWSLLYLGRAQIERIEKGEIEVRGRALDGSVILGPAPEQIGLVSPKSVWNTGSHRAGEYGTTLLRSLIPGRSFPYPKSLYAVEDALRIAVAGNPDALVLDFFAGSGTTAHAVFRLNRQDGGRRRSIMVTNNEVSEDEAKALRRSGHRPGDHEWEQFGIAEYITKPRITAAVTGRTPDGEPIKGDYKFSDEFPMAEGFAENVEFFDLTYEDAERIRYGLSFSAIAPLLWMRAGSEGRRIDAPTETFDVTDNYAVLFNLDAAAGFVEAVTNSDGLRVAYIVTDDESQYQMIAAELPGKVQTVRLYESYLRAFHVSSGED